MIRLAISRSPSRSSSRYSPPPAVAIVASDARSSDEWIGGSLGEVSFGFRGGSGISAAALRADADDEHRDVVVAGELQRARDFAAPRLTVGDQHEHLRVRRLAVQLLVLLDQPHAPVDAELDVGVPGRVVLEPERRLLRRGDRGRRRTCSDPCVSRICGAAMCANSASAIRSSFQRSDSPSMRRNRIDRCQRSPATSATRIDAEPSCRTTRSTPAVRTSDDRGGRPRQREMVQARRRGSGRARTAGRRRSGSARAPAAPVLPEPPRVAPPRATAATPQPSSSAAGSDSSHRIQRLGEPDRIDVDAS